MTVLAETSATSISARDLAATAAARDTVFDTMRGIAILMVIGIHSLPQPLDAIWSKSIDAALRCGLSGASLARLPPWKLAAAAMRSG